MNSVKKLFRRNSDRDERNVELSKEYELLGDIDQLPERQTERQTVQVFAIEPIPVTDDIEIVYVEKRELDAVSKDIQLLTEMARDINNILGEQKEQLEVIEENIEHTEVTLEAAQQEVAQAIKYSKSSKYKKGAITTTACAATGGAIGFIGGPIGAVIGAGIGGAVGIVGSTVSSMI